MTDLIEQFKKQFEELKNSLENALTPKTGEERRKRQAEEVQITFLIDTTLFLRKQCQNPIEIFVVFYNKSHGICL